MNTKKWDDPQFDAAQFAIDSFLNAKQAVSDQMAEIYQSINEGGATDDDRKRLKSLGEQYIALSKEVEDVMGRILANKQMPHLKV
jgi:chaperonin cofactor prefoldin